MKAAILAGGFGTRLRPVTYSVPKPLIPLLGRPLIIHIIESLPQSVDEVILAVNYMKDELEGYFGGSDIEREVILVEEDEPLGTGGALKNLRDHLDERFLAFNGDIISSLDIESLVSFHDRSGGIGTLSLWQVEDPTSFGVVETDSEGRILSFQEKPDIEEAESDLINAGVYVFEPDILDHIGEGKVSMEREVFPEVLDNGLFGFDFEGYWIDCGTRENFLKAQRTLLGFRAPNEGVETDGSVKFNAPNYLRNIRATDCSIGPHVGAEGTIFRSGCTVSNSIFLEGAEVQENARVFDSIVGPNTAVERGRTVKGTIVQGNRTHDLNDDK